MRLTCPNCGADYEVPAGMVQGGGRRVQCSACHTRWFVRGSALAAASEEQDPHPPRELAPAPGRRCQRPAGRRAPAPKAR